MIGRLLLLALASSLPAQAIVQDRMRTGMAESGVRAWSLQRDLGATELVGASASTFVSDNFSLGALVSRSFGPQARSFSVSALGRYYFLPLARFTPWLEGRLGGLVAVGGAPGATHLATGVGVRWRPYWRLCFDLQLVGAERWGYDDPSEGTDGTVEWVFQRLPLLPSRTDNDIFRLVPQPSLQVLF